ncbi:hypothetical protein V6Z12_D13G256700 [Gossypium hirsutum]
MKTTKGSFGILKLKNSLDFYPMVHMQDQSFGDLYHFAACNL